MLTMNSQQQKRGQGQLPAIFAKTAARSTFCAASLALLLASFAGVVQAQEDAQNEAPKQAEQAKAEKPVPVDELEDKTLEPHPADIEPRAPYELLLDVTRRGDKGFVAVGARGHILVSEDGINWEQKPGPVRAMLTAVSFINDKKGWAVGHDSVIIATTDGGETWTLQNRDTEVGDPFLDVEFFDENRGFAIGVFDMFYTTDDGGKTWVEYEEPLSLGEWHLNSIARLNDGTMVIVGETGLMSRSSDGGETWELIKGPYTGSYFGVKPLGEKGAVVFGLRGHAFVTDDISLSRVLPPDTDLGYKFKKPPTMTDTGTGSDSDSGGDAPPKSAEEVAAEQAKLEREQAEKAAAESAWEVVKNDPSVLSLFGATKTNDGGYVIVGTNGVIWGSDNHDANVELLPNTKDGGLSGVAETDDGNLVLVGEAGVYLYKRAK